LQPPVDDRRRKQIECALFNGIISFLLRLVVLESTPWLPSKATSDISDIRVHVKSVLWRKPDGVQGRTPGILLRHFSWYWQGGKKWHSQQNASQLAADRYIMVTHKNKRNSLPIIYLDPYL